MQGKRPGSFLKQYKEHNVAAESVDGEFERIYRDFCKLEQYLRKKEVIEQDPFKVFLHGTEGYQMLKREASGTQIHAEVQLLAEIVRLNIREPQDIYIGISKLSCLNCRVMLGVVNDIFQEKGIALRFDFGGRHDLDFDWNPPQLFAKGYYHVRRGSRRKPSFQERNSIEFKIGELTARQIGPLLGEEKPSGVSQYNAPSSSDSELTVDGQIEQCRTACQRMIEVLQTLPFLGLEIEKNIQLLSGLSKLESFKRLIIKCTPLSIPFFQKI